MFYVSDNSIRQAIRQIQRWIYAAEHDADPRIRLLHSNYAVGNIDMLRQMTTDDRVQAAAGVNALSLWARATKAQDMAVSRFTRRH